MKTENYKSAFWQNSTWQIQLIEMIKNPDSINEIGFSNFPESVKEKIFSFVQLSKQELNLINKNRKVKRYVKNQFNK